LFDHRHSALWFAKKLNHLHNPAPRPDTSEVIQYKLALQIGFADWLYTIGFEFADLALKLLILILTH
jgi:hypothetical protein